jgi:hypothetical protein
MKNADNSYLLLRDVLPATLLLNRFYLVKMFQKSKDMTSYLWNTGGNNYLTLI